ncbi:Tn3 family transposase [Lentzea sp. NPDC004782]|uniref:Tn3 family transposase n=1 Tax=Lentzea sp. NPDC004782 TaxID=3154458 RepID=UPI00339F7437
MARTALGLVVNCVAPWNTVYLDRILATLRESGYPVLDEDVLRIYPYWYAHINVHGHYSFQPLQLAEGIGRRPLRDPGRAGQRSLRPAPNEIYDK